MNQKMLLLAKLKTSWVVLEDSKKNEQVRLGDAVKMKYKKSYLDSVAKMTTSMLDQ